MSSKIFVGNLGFSVTNNDLTTKFQQYGEVTSAKVITDRDTGRSKGFAFVEMGNAAEASAAIEALNGSEFAGRQVNVSEAKPMEPRDNNRSSGGRYPRSR